MDGYCVVLHYHDPTDHHCFSDHFCCLLYITGRRRRKIYNRKRDADGGMLHKFHSKHQQKIETHSGNFFTGVWAVSLLLPEASILKLVNWRPSKLTRNILKIQTRQYRKQMWWSICRTWRQTSPNGDFLYNDHVYFRFQLLHKSLLTFMVEGQELLALSAKAIYHLNSCWSVLGDSLTTSWPWTANSSQVCLFVYRTPINALWDTNYSRNVAHAQIVWASLLSTCSRSLIHNRAIWGL